MAWGYWSATNIDRGRSPRRNNNVNTSMPMNPVPQSDPPAPQCYSPCQQRSPCTSACQSACQSPCQSPQHSVAGEQDPDTISQQMHPNQQQQQHQHTTSAEIGYDQQSLLSYNPHQQQQHHAQYQQHIIPLEEYHRRQSVERLDSPQVRCSVLVDEKGKKEDNNSKPNNSIAFCDCYPLK